MTQPKNITSGHPNDSLQNYFDELLLDVAFEPEPDDSIETPVSIISTTFQSTTPIKPPDAVIANVVIKTQTASAIEIPRFADPHIEQQEKLQKLLHSAQAELQVAPEIIAAPKITVTEIQEWDIETKTVVIEPVIELQEEEANQGYQMPGLEWMANGLPQWAQTRFEVLLIKVSGLTLAVPLISLGQIQPITDELTPIFGQADWFIGIQPTNVGKIRLVNTAKFVMPERYDENFVKNAKLMVSINGVPWGLAVDSVNQPISLEPDAIKWRTDRSKRPWLAGTIKDHMCALLDIPRIGQLLMESDKNLMKNHL